MPLNARPRTRAWLIGLGSAFALALQACGPGLQQQTNDENTLLDAPSRLDFPSVGDAMQQRCATLDCHGQVGRNLRLYGYGGLRLAATDSPIGNPTTMAEYNASYDSVIGLQPEVLSAVVDDQQDPNQLTLVRKTRGIEHHKGGQQAVEGDALDQCLVLWLTAKFDPAPCASVVNAPNPGNQ